MKCEIDGCKDRAKFALYQLKEDFTKRWFNVCDWHDKAIAQANQRIREEYSDGQWKEVSTYGQENSNRC